MTATRIRASLASRSSPPLPSSPLLLSSLSSPPPDKYETTTSSTRGHPHQHRVVSEQFSSTVLAPRWRCCRLLSNPSLPTSLSLLPGESDRGSGQGRSGKRWWWLWWCRCSSFCWSLLLLPRSFPLFSPINHSSFPPSHSSYPPLPLTPPLSSAAPGTTLTHNSRRPQTLNHAPVIRHLCFKVCGLEL